MSGRGIKQFIGFLALLLTLLVPAAKAGEIKGKVTDYADGSPLNGVRVSVSDGKKTKGPIATVNGDYKFVPVDAGNYTMGFDLTGYERPADYLLELKNAADVKQVDVALMREAADAEYYAKVGQRFALLVKQDGGKKEDYLRRWVQLRAIGPAPTAKVEIIRVLDKTDKNAQEQLPLKQYLNLKAGDIDEVAEPFKKVLRPDDKMPVKMPDKGFTTLGDEVVADIVLYELRRAEVGAKARDKFIEAFGQKWKGSKAADIVTNSYKVQHLKLTNPR
jgi:hypothetical protein